MTTFTTGIPLRKRNIQPPLLPVCGFTIKKTITGRPTDYETFYLGIGGSSGYSASGVPFSQSTPFTALNLQYGTYTVNEGIKENYTQVSITPSTFTLSAENPFQIVEIVNTYDLTGIRVTKVVTDHPESEHYFHVTLTGQSAEPTIVDGWVKQGEPITFEELPFDIYVLTEDAEDGYSLISISPDPITLSEGNMLVEVTVTNEMFTGKITITKVIV
jgi:hypothetical protein